jgi:murein DD-endopeptidase MepM/ murein hydrolase activator NlpD
MKKKNIVITILLVVFSLSFFFGLVSYYEKPVIAQTSCPDYMDPNSAQCFNYLQDQLLKLQQEEGSLQKQLKKEEYQQLSLSEKIAYIKNQITQTENTIKSLEIKVAAHNVEIGLLEKDIQKMEENVAVLGQEISVLESSVNRRVTESYKYSFVGPLELFLDIKNFSSILRKSKYLAITRTQDRESLRVYNNKVIAIKDEETLLNEKKADAQAKRNALEEEKIQLAEERAVLSQQKNEREYLLVLSKEKQAELLAELKRNKAIQAELDQKILAYINANMGTMTEEGYVAKGGKIGYVYPGGNACSGSTGPHLHFAASTTTSGSFYPNIDLYNGGYLKMGGPSGIPPAADGWDWKFLLAGKFAVPMVGSGVYITQDYHDPNLNYVKDSTESQYYATDISKLGGSANTTIVAAQAGYVKRGTDYCGQDYVIIYHPDLHNTQYRTIYVHLSFGL